jgi:hypothetical protein
MGIVTGIYEADYVERIQVFSPDECSLRAPTERVRAWKDSDLTTVFMAGTFDLPTPNHRLGLAEARLMAGALACDITYEDLQDNTPEDVLELVGWAAANLVRMTVTLDTDRTVANKKGFNDDKGACPKPLLGWKTRARNVASYTFPRPDGLYVPMVNFITAHGEDACASCPTCLSGDNGDMVTELQPDLVVVNAASVDTLRRVLDHMETGNLQTTRLGIANEESNVHVDELLGGRVSGTAIVRRARSNEETAQIPAHVGG